MNVRVGNYYPPVGGIAIVTRLIDILQDAQFSTHDSSFGLRGLQSLAYETHQRYEKLHPFTDGNGRSGRMLWMWMMRKAPLGFLHTWYYQSLNAGR